MKISSLTEDDDPSSSARSFQALRHSALARPVYALSAAAALVLPLVEPAARTGPGAASGIVLLLGCAAAAWLDRRDRRKLAPLPYLVGAALWLAWANLSLPGFGAANAAFAVLLLVAASAPWPTNARLIGQFSIGLLCVGLTALSGQGLASAPYAALWIASLLGVAVAFGLYEREVNRVEARLSHDATHDVLTGLANRRKAKVVLETEVERAIRRGERLALIACDIDHFKRINDALGHSAGDDILRGVAERLLEATRPYDCVARVGGEEFLLILPGCDQPHALAVAERARTLIEGRAFPARGILVNTTMSFGVSTVENMARGTPVPATLHTVLEDADAALYRAKEGGRNRVAVSSQVPADPDFAGGHA